MKYEINGVNIDISVSEFICKIKRFIRYVSLTDFVILCQGVKYVLG